MLWLQPRSGLDRPDADALPSVSVIVPVYDHGDRLGRCLEALHRQTYPAASFEVLVVDNGAGDALPDLSSRTARVRVLRETRPGSYAARNRGLAEASGDVLAFTDADCEPAPDWVARGVEALLASPDRGLVAGRIEVVVADARRPTAVEMYETAVGFRQRDYVERWSFGATANLFTCRGVFERVGPFDAELRSLGDREWGRRVKAAGFDLAYADDAVVKHPARRTLRELRGRSARVAGGFYSIATRKRWSLRALLRDAPMGLPDPRSLAGPPRRSLAVAGVGLFVVGIRVLELARLLAGRAPRRS